VFYGEQTSPLLMEYPCPGEPGAFSYTMGHTNLHSNILLGIGIEESERFGPTDILW
jgi:hypothetical protein